ncbi:unnamed protein product, partial [Brenthis ino]
MVWSVISARRVGRLYIVQGTIKQDQYRQILQIRLLLQLKEWFSIDKMVRNSHLCTIQHYCTRLILHEYQFLVTAPNNLATHCTLPLLLRGNVNVTTSLLECSKMFTTKTRVCKDLPVYNYNARPICEIAILQLSSKEPPSNCELSTFSTHVDTFQSIGNNQWIFLLRFKTPSVVECGNKIVHQEIFGSGIISLNSGCKFYTTFVTLNAKDRR